MAKTTGTDLPYEVVKDIFSTHVALGACKPKVLWAVRRIGKNGTTSDWRAVDANYQIIDAFLVASGGRIPKSLKLTMHFVEWLKTEGLTWAYRDAENCVDSLRCMMQSLQALKRDRNGAAPSIFPQLQGLIDKIRCDSPAKTAQSVPIVDAHSSEDECSSDSSEINIDQLFKRSTPSLGLSTPRSMPSLGPSTPRSTSSTISSVFDMFQTRTYATPRAKCQASIATSV